MSVCLRVSSCELCQKSNKSTHFYDLPFSSFIKNIGLLAKMKSEKKKHPSIYLF